jgi:hypothetical protein
MKCPECQELGLRSTVREIPSSLRVNWLAVERYWDENGVGHSHDLTKTESECQCSNGHRLRMTQVARCMNCDYGKDVEIRLVAKKPPWSWRSHGRNGEGGADG